MELQVIQNCIYEIRDRKVMLDSDLAKIYRVETKQLKRAVKRNTERFPPDFMFELTENEWDILRCQIGTSKLVEQKKIAEQPRRPIGFQHYNYNS